MTDEEVIAKTADFVKSELKDAEGGHDFSHVERVLNNAKTIARTEPANPFIVEIAALLHDIADSKFNAGDETIGAENAKSGDIDHLNPVESDHPLSGAN